MQLVFRTALAVSMALCVATWALANDGSNERRDASYVGVFYPALTGALIDPVRCPDASHPLLVSFSGTALTTEGRATFVQSHCVNADQSSLVRGVQDTTLASGWKMTGTYWGRVRPTPTTASDGVLVMDGHFRNTGGTGPYAKATGTGVAAGTIDTRTGATVIAVSGKL